MKKLNFVNHDWNLIVSVNENLGHYWKCIGGLEQKRWYAKEMHLREHLNIKLMDDDELMYLKRSQRGKNCITNAVNFDILSNMRYADAFFYTPMDVRSENHSSDMVARILYLAEQPYDTSKSGAGKFRLHSRASEMTGFRDKNLSGVELKEQINNNKAGWFDFGEDIEIDLD